jgi:uncharacterized protein (DUF1778 family)
VENEGTAMRSEPANSKSEVFSLRLTNEKRDKLREAAARENRSLGNYLVTAGLTLAERLQAA